jgi:ATP-dependent helicase/nuclease subunit A
VSPDRPLELDDDTTRLLAQAEFSRPLVVEAGAGTGKTALLVARVAAWCVGEGWERHTRDDDAAEAVARRVVEGVVAITFTEAAAAEMASRIAEALIGLAAGEEPIGWSPGETIDAIEDDQLAARAIELAGAVHRLRVTTIHAYCQGLLAAHPFEAGLHPRFEIDADGMLIEGVVDEVVENALREIDEKNDPGPWEPLAAVGVGPVRVAEALRELVLAGARPTEFDCDPYGAAAAVDLRDELERAFAAFFEAEDGCLIKVPRSPAAGEAREALAEAAQRLADLTGPVTATEIQHAIEDLAGPPLQRLRKWARADLTQGERTLLDDVADDVVAAAGRLVDLVDTLLSVDLEAFAAARSLVGGLLREIEETRRIRGLVTFTDLLQRAADLLETHDDLCRSERHGIDQLLVDEFQDTDDVQCRIVARLALDGPAEERPGLFIVGDPKQSIYAWRSADLAAYDAFVRRVIDSGGVRGPLTRNFRSVRPILDEVERVVEPVMEKVEGLQPAFESLEATGPRAESHGFDHAPWSAVEHWVCWPRDEDGTPTRDSRRAQPTTELEAAAIATDIRRLHDEAGVRYGDAAVLLRATTAQGPLLEAFRERGVPFEVAREREYFRQREIVEAAALIRSILEPTDVLALMTVIRSDVVGVPDAALAPLWAAGLPAAAAALDGFDATATDHARSVVQRAAAQVESAPGLELVPDWPDALIGALEVLAELRRSVAEDPPDVFVERLRTLWLAEAAAAARSLGRFRQARLDAFYADLERALERSEGSSAALARFLRRAVEEGREAPTVSEPDRDADAVHVMTIYGAKGLDFEHVYLAQVHKRTGGFGSSPAAVLRRFEGRSELELFGWPTPGFARAERRRELQARAERVRLLYVAMTRAKRRLVVSGGWAVPRKIVDPMDASTIADLLARRADRELLDDLIERRADRAPDREPAVSWVLPALVEGLDETPPPSTEDSPARPVSAADDAEAIARARSAAERRMAARWSMPASDAAHRSRGRREDELEEEGTSAQLPIRRAAAAAVGTAVHHLLESVDLDRDLASQVAERTDRVIDEAVAELEIDESRVATEALGRLLDQLQGSACLAKLAELAPSIAARELDIVARPDADDGTSVVSGAVDLLYTDPVDGRLVVADYKTDAVEGGDEITARCERYRPQLETYGRALARALDLEEEPHLELWFLRPDRIVRLT